MADQDLREFVSQKFKASYAEQVMTIIELQERVRILTAQLEPKTGNVPEQGEARPAK